MKKTEPRKVGPCTNNCAVDFFENLSDNISVQIQQLHTSKKIYDDQPLLRIDNREETKHAQFQFDIVQSVLHRTGCTAIPIRSQSALYALWEIKKEDLQFACDLCKPALQLRNPMGKTTTSDLLYGFLSIIDQFSSVLSERGREFRESEKGKEMESIFASALHELDMQQKKSIDLLISSLDSLINVVRDYNNGHDSLKEHVNDKRNGKNVSANRSNGKAKGRHKTRTKSTKK